METKPRKCPICQGTGFAKGEICPCITGKGLDLPDGMPDIFKDIFGGFANDPAEKGGTK
jgi:hypothetical protein